MDVIPNKLMGPALKSKAPTNCAEFELSMPQKRSVKNEIRTYNNSGCEACCAAYEHTVAMVMQVYQKRIQNYNTRYAKNSYSNTFLRKSEVEDRGILAAVVVSHRAISYNI